MNASSRNTGNVPGPECGRNALDIAVLLEVTLSCRLSNFCPPSRSLLRQYTLVMVRERLRFRRLLMDSGESGRFANLLSMMSVRSASPWVVRACWISGMLFWYSSALWNAKHLNLPNLRSGGDVELVDLRGTCEECSETNDREGHLRDEKAL